MGVSSGRKVGVLVVDDSPLCRQLICDALEKDSELEILGTAENGEEAIRKVQELRPNVVTLDVDMPVMDGLTAVEHIMQDNPTPILMLTADPRQQAPELTCRALELGALALQVKPALDAGPEAWNLAREVKLLSTVRVIRHRRGAKKFAPLTPLPVVETTPMNSSIGLVVIGASTGGPQVLQKLIADLPAEFPAPIVIVQHINSAFAESLAGWLQHTSRLKIKLAREGDALMPGHVLIAAPGSHLVVASRGRVGLRAGEDRDGHKPSASLLMESAAQLYGRRTVGMLLTGMGEDGAAGMQAIKAAGGRTLVQNEESCVVFGMPGAAIARGAVDQIVHADELAGALMRLARSPLVPTAAVK